jgi:phosphatidylglycerophosphatase C
VRAKKIAFFDFDGTITKKDTLLEIIKFQKGRLSFYLGFTMHLPWLLAYKLKLLDNVSVKERILTYFFGGLQENIFQRQCDLFGEEVIPRLVRPGALKEIKNLQDLDFQVVIVSASAVNWISEWAHSHSLKLIATKLAVKNGLITGRIDGKNCQGEQKVTVIRDIWNLDEFEEIYVYGDTVGDRPMMTLATKSFFKPFRSI